MASKTASEANGKAQTPDVVTAIQAILNEHKLGKLVRADANDELVSLFESARSSAAALEMFVASHNSANNFAPPNADELGFIADCIEGLYKMADYFKARIGATCAGGIE